MHALVLLPVTPAAGSPVTPSVATALAAAHHGFAGPTTDSHDATAATVVVQQVADHPDHGAGHGSMPSALHQVLHLCLAILAGMLVLGMAALALWATLRLDWHERRIGARVRPVPRPRPPPTSVRLAQLCVLRN